MTARRIARELAVIVLPQLPKKPEKLASLDIEDIAAKCVAVLTDHAKECLSEADGFLNKCRTELTEYELGHRTNRERIEIAEAPLTTETLRQQMQSLTTAINLISEALDVPEVALVNGHMTANIKCKKCGTTSEATVSRPSSSEVHFFFLELVSTFQQNKKAVDEIIRFANARWTIDRMVSMDRSILRLAITEAFFLTDIPVKVCINEAVELSHRFADERAAKFINGILGDVAGWARAFRDSGEFPDFEAMAREGNIDTDGTAEGEDEDYDDEADDSDLDNVPFSGSGSESRPGFPRKR